MLTQTKARPRSAMRAGQGGVQALVLPVLAAFVAGTAVLLALVAVSAYVFSRVDLPLATMIPLATMSIGAAVFAAAFTFAVIYGHHGLVAGFLTGILLFFMLCAASAVSSGHEFTQLVFLKGAMMAVCGALGGFCGSGWKQKRKKGMRHP